MGNDAWQAGLVDSLEEYAIFRLTPAGKVASWNAGAAKIFGYDSAEVVGQSASRFCAAAGERAEDIVHSALAAVRQQGRFETERWSVRKDGSRFWANILIVPLDSNDDESGGFGVVIRDGTDKRVAHEAVLESERRFRLLVQGVTDYSLFMLSPEGLVTNWNLGASRIKGYEASEVLGTHFRRFYVPEDAARGLPEKGLQIATAMGRYETEGWRVRKDGSRFWANVVIDAIRDESGKLVGFAKITRDVTDRKTAQEQLEKARAALLQAQKMEAIGKLTGGVAHDFNNVLQVLRGNLELLERRHSRDVWSRERVAKALDAADQGANLASQLLAFGRRQPLEPVATNLGVMLRSMDDMLRRALGETISVETVVVGGLWNTLVDPNRLENVVLNLAINARDAMPGGGKLTLELSNAMLDDQYGALPADVPPGQYVLLAISDTGTGMTPQVLERALEPYFTTKPEGEGTGLGLSMAYGFVSQSHGHLRIYTEEGHGTTVKVYLPRTLDEVAEVPDRQPAMQGGGTETILVVEDDPHVRSTAVEMLSELGYTVLKAADPQGAIVILNSGARVDLLFSDVVMPGPLRSTEMARMALKNTPDLKVLFTSGYTQNAIVHAGRLDPGVHLLGKPYSRTQLANKVRTVLDRPASSPVRRDITASVGAPTLVRQVAIVVVDDDAASCDAVSELLTEAGYAVTKAADCETALDALGQSRAAVLITDVRLAGQSGTELAARAVEADPALRVILMSGDLPPGRDELPFCFGYLRKPFSADELNLAIVSVMKA
ncbi:PAS domain S-box protein [Paraburkholderia sp. Ac-20347]|uniref:PAS domain S-box protein n=1 Tax=Paraburkholderia sp. Ac-20347 TaxID=2703892 RepID=UPI00197E9851|nr:PAS domain S-box protein [Paraburkholderia sp. Ac-20347]MBN3812813.1 PAS domain S-box protein [Paraburkholderia sp. Ac-20347]